MSEQEHDPILAGDARLILSAAQVQIPKKRCPGCKKVLFLDSFNRDRSSRDGHEGWCRKCRNRYRRRLWAEQPECRLRMINRTNAFRRTERGQQSRRRSAWKKRYGLSEEEYCELRDAQNNCCAICGEKAAGEWDLCVDHHHGTKVVRGLLCKPCNTGLGMAKDSVSILLAMVRYLERTGKVAAAS